MREDGSGASGTSVAAESRSSDGQGSMLEEFSRAMVRLYKEQFGRGPTKARSYWGGDDMLTCVLEDSLTPAERNLLTMGEDQRLRDVRMCFQYATLTEFVGAAERITGRTVRSFISGIDSAVDVSVETFIFHPRGSDAPSRAEMA